MSITTRAWRTRMTMAGATVLILPTASTAVAATTPRPDPAAAVADAVAEEDPLGAVAATPGPEAVRRARHESNNPAAQFILGRACVSGPTAATVTDDAPIRVNLPPYYSFTVGRLDERLWKTPPPGADSGWILWFTSMRWAQEYGQTAAQAGQRQALMRIVDQVGRFYASNPDRGQNTAGWDEGSSLRRLETLNCLYQLSGDARIPSWMAGEVKVQQGPRYYGPPNKTVVHNHGTMANIAIVTAGLLTHNRSWQTFAANRLLAESPHVFTPKGVSKEQSAAYQSVNVTLWDIASRATEAVYPGDARPATLSARLDSARAVTQWLTEPDGKWVQIGDTPRTPGSPNPGGGDRSAAFRDDASGYIVGRWSWTNPATTYFTARYGPAIRSHGHLDKSSVTFTTRGSRVLIGPGYGNDRRGVAGVPWWRLAAAQNTSSLGTCPPLATSAVSRHRQRGDTASVTMTGVSCKVTHTRSVAVNHAAASMTVSDAYSGRGVHRQSWHLDPEWKGVRTRKGDSMTFRNSRTGQMLAVVTNGRVDSVRYGRRGGFTSWNYVTLADRLPAADITISSRTRTLQTTFQMR